MNDSPTAHGHALAPFHSHSNKAVPIDQNDAAVHFDLFADQSCEWPKAVIIGDDKRHRRQLVGYLMKEHREIGYRVWSISGSWAHCEMTAKQYGKTVVLDLQAPISINPFSHAPVDMFGYMPETPGNVILAILDRDEIDEPTARLVVEAITEVWNALGRQGSITAVYEYLIVRSRQDGNDGLAREIAAQLLPFTRRGKYGAFFDGQGEDIFDGRQANVVLPPMDGDAHFRRVALVALTVNMSSAFHTRCPRELKGRLTLCVFDEIEECFAASEVVRRVIGNFVGSSRMLYSTCCITTSRRHSVHLDRLISFLAGSPFLAVDDDRSDLTRSEHWIFVHRKDDREQVWQELPAIAWRFWRSDI